MAAKALLHTNLFNDANLVAYYQLEDTSDSKGSNNLTNNNSASFDAQLFNNGVDFGTGNTTKSLTVANDLGISSSHAISIVGWGKINQAIGMGQTWAFFTHNSSTGHIPISLYYQVGTPNKLIVDDGDSYINYNITLTPGTLYHFAVNRDGSGNTELFVNGVSVGTGIAGTGTYTGFPFFGIGMRSDGFAHGDTAMDDVAVFSRILISTEISGLVAGTLPGASSASSSVSPSVSPSSSKSPSASVSPSSSVSASKSPSSSQSASISPSGSPSPTPSPSISSSPSAGYTDYSRMATESLPINNNDLQTIYTEQEVEDVSEVDGVFVGQEGVSDYVLHQFKNFVASRNFAQLEWVGQSSLAPSNSPVYFQIFNQITNGWDTIDSNSTSRAEKNFHFLAILTDLTNYKDQSNVISCRIYQLAQ